MGMPKNLSALRTKIGAGTSNLALGATSTTALAGNTTTISSTQTSDITANNAKVTDTGLPAIIVDDAAGNMSFGNANVTATTVRAQIGAGTGDGDVTLTGTQTLTNKTLTTPVINQISPSAGLLQIDGAGSVDGGIKLMCSAGSHGQILKSQPHSASVTNTMLLPAGANSTLVSNVSSSALTNKTGNISMWTNDSGYLTSYTEADTLATVTGRGATTTTESTFNGGLIVKNEITVNKTNVNTPGKITINGNTDATLQLKSEDTALAANETLGVIEFYGSDGTAPGAGVKSSIRARNGAQTGGVGDTSNLIFAVSDGLSNNNEALRINPTVDRQLIKLCLFRFLSG